MNGFIMKVTNSLKNKITNFLIIIFSVFILLLIWQLSSNYINSALILPKPIEVLEKILILLASSEFWFNFFNTIVRIIVSFLISIFVGFIIGFLCGKNEYLQIFFKIPLEFIRVCPVISIILMMMYCFSSSTIPIFVSVLMTIPIMITSIEKSFSNKDIKLYDMAEIYKIRGIRKIIFLDFYTVKNPFWTSIISIFGMTWKVVVAGEVLCLPKKGLGSLLQKNSVHLNTDYVFALTILLVFFSFLIEQVLSFVIKKFLLVKKENKCQF